MNRFLRIAFRVAGVEPEFEFQLRDKGPSGRDYAKLFKEKDGWTWMRVDPGKGAASWGYSRKFLTPKELVRDIQNYTTMDSDAKEALAYFEELAKQEEAPAAAPAPATASVRFRTIASWL